MDVSSFRVGDWLLVAGGSAMLVLAQLFDWATIETQRGRRGIYNAFDYPATGGLAWLLTVAAGVLAFLLAGGVIRQPHVPWAAILVGGTALATLLMVLRLILGAGDIELVNGSVDLGRGAGMWLALLAAAVALAGAVRNHLADGGTLRDLADVRRLGRTAGRRPPPGRTV